VNWQSVSMRFVYRVAESLYIATIGRYNLYARFLRVIRYITEFDSCESTKMPQKSLQRIRELPEFYHLCRFEYDILGPTLCTRIGYL
jgi:hypothetical protein